MTIHASTFSILFFFQLKRLESRQVIMDGQIFFEMVGWECLMKFMFPVTWFNCSIKCDKKKKVHLLFNNHNLVHNKFKIYVVTSKILNLWGAGKLINYRISQILHIYFIEPIDSLLNGTAFWNDSTPGMPIASIYVLIKPANNTLSHKCIIL